MTLAELAPGEAGIIVSCAPSSALGLRLLALGLTPRTPIICLMHAPFGDPSAYRVRGTVLCIGKEAAALVQVRMPWYNQEKANGGDTRVLRSDPLRPPVRPLPASSRGGHAGGANHPL